MAKREKQVHRLNLAIELELLETLRETARKRFNAPLHHVSGQPEISQTIVKLLELGLKALNEEDEYVYEEDKPQSLKQKYEGLERRFEGLAENLDRFKERIKTLEVNSHIPIQITTHIEEEALDNQDESTHTTTQIDIQNNEEVFVKDELEKTLTHIPIQITTHIDQITELKHIPMSTFTHIKEDGTNTMTKADMARFISVQAPNVTKWVKSEKWDKFPTDWSWNPLSGKHGLFERKL